MPEDGLVRHEADDQNQSLAPQPDDSTDPKQRALAIGLEFSKRALEADSLDELFLILTNDMRTLIPFDRVLLVTHLGGQSKFAAATNQPVLQEKFDFYELVSELAGHLRGVDKGVLLSANADRQNCPRKTSPARQGTGCYLIWVLRVAVSCCACRSSTVMPSWGICSLSFTKRAFQVRSRF